MTGQIVLAADTYLSLGLKKITSGILSCIMLINTGKSYLGKMEN
jgi:hypothetical protein